jgi:N-acetylmuramic acid 6-phosphate etherase
VSRLPRTEAMNPKTVDLDRLPTDALLARIAEEDATVPAAVAAELPAIAAAVDAIVERLLRGGRLIYLGAGTSGRLAVMEAAETGPTFSTEPDQVIGLMAGGRGAEWRSDEGAEDDRAAGAAEIAALRVDANDAVVALSASGSTPFAVAAAREARRRGALTVSIACDHPTPLADAAELAIHPQTGPEVVAGSTRLRAGTAQKLVLNMLTTAAMVRLGKVYRNLMVDVRATNRKLRARATRIVAEVTERPPAEIQAALEASGWSAKLAIAMLVTGLPADAARERLVASRSLAALIDDVEDRR